MNHFDPLKSMVWQRYNTLSVLSNLFKKYEYAWDELQNPVKSNVQFITQLKHEVVCKNLHQL